MDVEEPHQAMEEEQELQEEEQEEEEEEEQEASAGPTDEERLSNMEDIEREFVTLKEQIFKDEIQALKQELAQVRSGSNQRYLELVQELEALREQKLWRAEQWHKYQLETLKSQFDYELQQAADEFESDKKQLKNRMANVLQSRLKRLEEQKNFLNLDDADLRSASNRQLRKRTREREAREFRARKLNPPHINYTLKDVEIYEDLNYMNKYHPGDPDFDAEYWFSRASAQ